jgi:TldD protein
MEKLFLEKYSLYDKDVERILWEVVGPGVDDADIYFEYSKSETWGLEEGIVKHGEFNIDQGFGFRVISGDKTGFAYADELDLTNIKQAAKFARNIVNSGKSAVVAVTREANINSGSVERLYPAIDPLNSFDEAQKITLLKNLDVLARSCDHRVERVNVDLSGAYKMVLIVDNSGAWSFDIRPMVQLNISILVNDGIKKELGNCSMGRRSGYEIFLDENLGEQCAKEAVRIALVNLEAVAAPAGTMPVVLGSGWPAVMLHEAVGHGLEADFNRREHSVYTGMLGKQIASREVSIVDQGNMPGNKRGSLNIDDEGTPTQRTLLIENGVLRSYMYDRLNARLMGTSSTGNGRRSSYAYIPLPRMTNTYMLEGSYMANEIISSVDRGIYAVNFSGGQVDITSGEFVFSTSEAYLIEKGHITSPIKGATLIGNGPNILHKISMVGNDLAMDRGVGMCGKQGQTVAVGIGQPTLKIDELTVGGSAIG